MNRRSFLKNSALTVAGLSMISKKVAAQDNSERVGGPKFKLSLNAYSFNQYLREGKISLDELLEFCARLGFDAIDPTGYYFPGYPLAPADQFLYEFKRKAHILGLDISGTGVKNDFTVPEKAKREADKKMIRDWIVVSAKMGAPVLRVFAGKTNPENYTWDQIAAWMADDLGECAEYASKYGVLLALQNHAEFIKTSDQAIKILEMVNSKWLGLHLDIGSFPTEDPYVDIEKTVKYAVNWQIKEYVKILDTKVKTDLKRLFAIIKKENYRGYLPLETLGPGDPYKKVTKFLGEVKKEI